MNLIRYVLGDYSADGHGITSTFILRCSVDDTQLEELINKGQKITGINLDRLCDNYEDSSIPNGVYNYMKSKGIEFDSWVEAQVADGEHAYVSDDDYMNLIIALAKEADPDVVIEFANEVKTINSGYAYGLFSL